MSSKTILRGLLGAWAALLCMIALGQACTLAWDAVTTNTDGSAITDLAGYRLYYKSPGSTTVQLLGEVGPTSVTLSLTCPKGDLWVTAINIPGIESEPSNIVRVRQPNKVNAFTVTR